mgnify:CR=1 FL=1
MSVYPEFPSVAAALEAWRAGQCPRRHVVVEGQVRDLLAEDRPVRVQREEYVEPRVGPVIIVSDAAIVIDDGVQIVTDAPAPPPSVRECCRMCGRPLIGEAKP